MRSKVPGVCTQERTSVKSARHACDRGKGRPALHKAPATSARREPEGHVEVGAAVEQASPGFVAEPLCLRDDASSSMVSTSPPRMTQRPSTITASTSLPWPWCTKSETTRRTGTRCGRCRSITMRSALLPATSAPAVGNPKRAIAIDGGPAVDLLGRWLPAVLAPHPLHEQCRAQHLDHVLGHVVGAHGDPTAVGCSRSAMRGLKPRRAAIAELKETVTLARAQSLLLLRHHAAAVRGDQPIVEKAQIVQIFGRQAAALGLDGGDLAPDLVEVDRGERYRAFVAGRARRAGVPASTCREPRRRRRCGCAPRRCRAACRARSRCAARQRSPSLRSTSNGDGVADRAFGLVPGPLASTGSAGRLRPDPRRSSRCRCASSRMAVVPQRMASSTPSWQKIAESHPGRAQAGAAVPGRW